MAEKPWLLFTTVREHKPTQKVLWGCGSPPTKGGWADPGATFPSLRPDGGLHFLGRERPQGAIHPFPASTRVGARRQGRGNDRRMGEKVRTAPERVKTVLRGRNRSGCQGRSGHGPENSMLRENLPFEGQFLPDE